MSYSLFHNSKKYNLIEYENEKQLENLISQNADNIFGKSSCLLMTKKRIGNNSNGISTIPDGYLLDLSLHEEPMLYYVEVELSKHSVTKHIIPQLSKFHAASANDKQSIMNTILESINLNSEYKSRIRRFLEKSKKFENINALINHLVIETPLEVIIVIDNKVESIEEVLNVLKVKTHIIEFNTYELEGDYIFNFEPFQNDILDSDPLANDLDLIDTIVVPAREDGFQNVFLNENRWYSLRISDKVKSKLKYIAAYQTSPVKKITHYAEIKSIDNFENSGKLVVTFKDKAKELTKPLELGPGNNSGFLQAPRYTVFSKILSSKYANDLWKK